MPYRPWTYASAELLRDYEQRRFAAEARRRQEEESRKRQEEAARKEKGGGFFDRVSGFVDAVTPEFVEGPAKAVGKVAGRAGMKGLELLEGPAEHTLRPLIGALTYLEAQEKVDPQTGRRYRAAPTFGDVLAGWKELMTQSPVESYQEGRQAFRERMADPEHTAGSRFFLGAASDPLTYLGPGAVKLGAKALGPRAAAAIAGDSRAARFTRTLLENESAAQGAGILAGGTLGAETAERLGVPYPELTGGLAGGVAGAIAVPRYGSVRGMRRVGEDIATAQGRPGRMPAIGLATEDVSPTPVKRAGVTSLRHSDVKIREDVFQAKAKMGTEEFEKRVSSLEKRFDPNELTPGLLVHDVVTDEYIVMAGHTRVEAAKRAAAAGKFADEMGWEVFDADLSNPAHYAYLQRLADFNNTQTEALTLGENLNILKRAVARGETVEEAVDELRNVGPQTRRDLIDLMELPEDLVAEIDVRGADSMLGAEIGAAARRYGLTETDVRALWARYRGQAMLRADMKRTMELLGRAREAERARGAQGGFGGADWEAAQSTVLDDIDLINGHYARLEKAQTELTSLREAVLRQGEKLPGLKAEQDSYLAALEREIASAREAIAQAETDFKATLEGRQQAPTRAMPDEGEGKIPAESEGMPAPEVPAAAVEVPEEPPRGLPEPEARPEEPAPPPPEEPSPAAGPTPEPEAQHPGGEFARAAEEGAPPPPLDTSNAYATLGLEPGQYDAKAIRNAYRAQARRYHPDINTAETAHADMKAINNAFDQLSGEAAARGTTSGEARSTTSRAQRSRRGRWNEEQRSRAQAEKEWRQRWEQEQREAFRRYQADRTRTRGAGEDAIRGRPEGEPERIDIPDGEGRPVDELRRDAPFGYRLVVPDEGPVYYRRLITNDTIRELHRHPTPPPISERGARDWFGGTENVDDVLERWYEAAIRWNPRFAGPTDTLTRDFGRMRRAAGKALREQLVKDALGDLGIEELKELSPRARAAFWRQVRREARLLMDEVHEQILREEWYEPIRPSMGQGYESRSDYGMTGEGVTPAAISGEPPHQGGPPPETPPPARGKGGTQPFGSTEPVDLLRAQPRGESLAEGARDTVYEKLGNAFRKAMRIADPELETIRRKVNPFLKEYRRQLNRARHLETVMVEMERAKLARAGIELRRVDNVTHMFADGRDLGIFDDVVERMTDEGGVGFEALTPDQQEVIAYFGETNRLLNETKQFHGAKVEIDPDIKGEYFGRRVLSYVYETAEGERVREAGETFGPSRRVGATRTKSRIFDSVDELVKAGFRLDDPWTARRAIIRAKLLDSMDAYFKNNIEPLRANKTPLATTVGLEQIGHPAFNGQWYEPAVARRIRAGLEPKRPAIPILAQINRVLTPLRASFDLSATFQQGLRLWTSNPKAASEYWWAVVRSLKDEKVYQNVLLQMDDRARAAGFDNGLTDIISYGNRYTGAGAGTEFTLPSDVLARIGKTKAGKPLAKGFEVSNAHFDRTLNLYRLHMALNQAERLKALDLDPAAFDEAMKMSARAGNRAFGWTETETTGLEDSLVFAPRYTRASVETLMRAISDGGLEGAAARKHMILMLGEGALLVAIFNELRGKETTWDPTDPNFLRFRDVAGLDVSPFGTYNTLFRAIAQVVAGDDPTKSLKERRPTLMPLKRFAEGKLSPSAAMAWWPAKGETYLGEPLAWDSPEVARRSLDELSASFLPFTAQTILQEGPLSAVVSGFGLSNTPVTPTEHRNVRREQVAEERFGTSYDDLTGAQKAEVNRDETVLRYQEEADRNTLTRRDERSAVTKATTEAAGKFDALGEELAAGRITGNQYRDQYELIQAELRGAREAVGATEGRDKVLSGWYDLYDEAEDATGRTDYDLLDQLRAEYREQHPDVDERLLKAVGAHDNEVTQRYREAQKQASEYYTMPAYRGMSLEESRRATSVLMNAQDRVSFGQARNMQHALRQIGVSDPEGMRLAMRAQRVGPNPLRREYRRSHPLFAEFYSDIV